MSEHVLTTLNTVGKQKIKEVVDCLKERFGRNRLEQIEELLYGLEMMIMRKKMISY